MVQSYKKYLIFATFLMGLCRQNHSKRRWIYAVCRQKWPVFGHAASRQFALGASPYL